MLRLVEKAKAGLENSVNVVSYETYSVVTVELALSEEACSNVVKNFAK